MLIAKINMKKNEPPTAFPIYRYPSIYIIFKDQDNQANFLFEKIVASNKKELIHLIFRHSQVMAKDYDDRIYYEIMNSKTNW